jgi:hypothetical protein
MLHGSVWRCSAPAQAAGWRRQHWFQQWRACAAECLATLPPHPQRYGSSWRSCWSLPRSTHWATPPTTYQEPTAPHPLNARQGLAGDVRCQRPVFAGQPACPTRLHPPAVTTANHRCWSRASVRLERAGLQQPPLAGVAGLGAGCQAGGARRE